MANIEELLKPIPGANPSGVDLFDDPIFEKIKDARRTDTGGALELEEAKAKIADYGLVAKLATDALTTKSKDLRIASWLTEALLSREGYGGLRDGLDVMRGLIERFWDTVYPEIEDGDAGARVGPLGFIGEKTVNVLDLNLALDALKS
jgi:type VI secretion system protein ImpA